MACRPSCTPLRWRHAGSVVPLAYTKLALHMHAYSSGVDLFRAEAISYRTTNSLVHSPYPGAYGRGLDSFCVKD